MSPKWRLGVNSYRSVQPRWPANTVQKGGYWLAPQNGRGVAMVVFETEEEARTAAAMFRVGEPPMPDAPEGVTVETVEVREVLAAV